MAERRLGPYEIEGLLGEGGIGQVYAARDSVLGRRVAIKMLRPELADNRELVDRFFIEAKSLGNLTHPNITTIHALHTEGADVFMVMELVEGETLEAVLAREKRLQPRVALAVLAQTIAGLAYAHGRGVIHRDIKPSNLMIATDGLVKIMDFGIAKIRDTHLTQTGVFQGTLSYASPEQILGSPVDERTDQYSLAIVLYKMLAGNAPFAADSEYKLMTAHLQMPPPPLPGRLPRPAKEAVMRALAKGPEERFASIEEFGRAVGAAAIRGEAIDILQRRLAVAPRDAVADATRIMPSASFRAHSLGADHTPPPKTEPPSASSAAWPASPLGHNEPSVSSTGTRAVRPPPLPAPRNRRWMAFAAIGAAVVAAGVAGALLTRPKPTQTVPTAANEPMPPSAGTLAPLRSAPSAPDAVVPTPPAAPTSATEPPPVAMAPPTQPAPPVAPPPQAPTVAAPPEPPTPTLAESLSTRMAALAPALSEKSREEMVRTYLTENDHKAMAVSPEAPGTWESWNRPSAESAEESVLENCQVAYGHPCILVATDGNLAAAPADGTWQPQDMQRVRYAGEFDPAEIPGVIPPVRERTNVAGYRSAPGPKAASFSPRGGRAVYVAVGGSDQHAAEADALKLCNDDATARGACYLYASDNQVVLPKRLTEPMTASPPPVSPAPAPVASTPVAAAAPEPGAPPNAAAKPEAQENSAAMVAPPPVPVPAAPSVEGEAAWSQDERREVQQALRTLGDLDSEPDGNFGPQTQTAIAQFQSFEGESATGFLTEPQRRHLLDMARRLAALLEQPPRSPAGIAAVSLRSGAQRLARAASSETAGKASEAAYWYRLAAADGEAKGFTNLGTLLVRGQGGEKADPAAARLLWLVAAAHGEPVAMFNLGAMYERGIGVDADKEAARKWYERAAAHGHPQARDALKRLGS